MADGTVPMAVIENSATGRSLRFPDETEAAFRNRIERTARIARVLMEACFNNETVQDYIADPDIPFFTEQSLRGSPIVRVEYEQAVAFGGIGETLRATKSKSWGEGPFILPLEPDDWFYPERITYCYRENSLYNRRFEQRRRMKEMLGKHRRKLVETAKYHTKTIFLDLLTDEEARVINRLFGVEPGIFWRAAKGKAFLDLTARWIQQELPFAE